MMERIKTEISNYCEANTFLYSSAISEYLFNLFVYFCKASVADSYNFFNFNQPFSALCIIHLRNKIL